MGTFGDGTGLVLFSELACIGIESSLFDCPRAPVHNCGHNLDVGIICPGKIHYHNDNIYIYHRTYLYHNYTHFIAVIILHNYYS